MQDNEDYFEYDTYTEAPEELDFSRLKPCPHCKKPIPEDALNCLYCGGAVDSSRVPRWVTLAAVFILLIFLAFVLF